MKLTDEQLHILLQCDFFSIQTTRTLGICEELERLKLLAYNGNGYWRLTSLGYKALHEDMVRALYVMPYHTTRAANAAARKYFGTLSLEKLSSLLAHRSNLIRTYAKERLKELTNGTDC